jgi:hypothetical protein
MMPATMTTSSDLRGRLSRSDPLIIVSCLVALVVYLLHGFDGILSRDLGVYSYGGQQVAEGVPPYVGILNRAGPLAHLIPGIGVAVARAVGVDDILGMRLLFLLISVACVGLVYALGRDLFRSRLSGLASAASLLCFQGFIQYASYGPREKTAMVLFLIVALLAMVHQRWATSGVFISLATLTWQPVFFAAIAGVVVAVLLGVPSGRARALVRVAIGGLVPTALTVGSYAAIGSLGVFMDDFVLINVRYTQQTSILDHPGASWRAMIHGFGGSLWVLLLGAVVLVALTIHAVVRREGRREPLTAALVGSGVVFLVGVLWSMRAFDSWPDTFLLLPGGALGIGGLAGIVDQRLPRRAGLATTLGWTVAATAMALVYSITARDDTLDHQRESVDIVLGVLSPHARILSVGAPQPLVLSRQRNLTRYQLFGNGLIDYLDDTWPGGSHGYGRWIGRREPTLIALGRVKPPWLTPTLDGAYLRIGHAPGWTWYVRRDVGAPTLQDLRTALNAQS